MVRSRMCMLGLIAAAAWPAGAALTTISVKPSDTTAGIDPAYDKPHYAMLDPALTPRGRLFVFLPGTDADPSIYREITETAAGAGLHAVGLMHVNPSSYFNLFTNNCDDCYVQAHVEIVTGADASPFVQCDRANSIEHRLVTLLQYLQVQQPAANWTQFLAGTNVLWNKVSLAGHSQGGTHAMFIASRQVVDRLLTFSSTDWYGPSNRPALWMLEPFATPSESMFGFAHTNDPLFLAERQLPTWVTLGLDEFAPATFVDAGNAGATPFGCAHMFRTAVQPRDNFDSLAYHGSVVQDRHVPRLADGVTPIWKPLWTFMLTGPKRCQEDFDGDGLHDLGVFHPPSGLWHLAQSVDGPAAIPFGYRGTVPFERDFDGDGELDLCVYDSGIARWYLLESVGGYRDLTWGSPGQAPAPGDFDGDGRDDLAVYAASNGMWRIQYAKGGSTNFFFGYAGTVPVEADYDGDGRCDAAVFEDRTGSWFIRYSRGGTTNLQFGYRGTIPMQGDFDGDGRADPAVFDPKTAQWFLLCGLAGFQTAQFGFSGVMPVNRDYDGDGKADLGVYHPPTGQWYLQQSHNGFRRVGFGYSGTIPLGRP